MIPKKRFEIGEGQRSFKALSAIPIIQQISAIPQNKPSFYILQPVQIPEVIFVNQQMKVDNASFLSPQQVSTQNSAVLEKGQNDKNGHSINLTSASLSGQSNQLLHQEKQIVSFMNPSNLMPRGIFNPPQPLNPQSYIIENSLGTIPQSNIQHQIFPVNATFRSQYAQIVQTNSLPGSNCLPDPRFTNHVMKPNITLLDRQQYELLRVQPQFVLLTDPKVQVSFQPK